MFQAWERGRVLGHGFCLADKPNANDNENNTRNLKTVDGLVQHQNRDDRHASIAQGRNRLGIAEIGFAKDPEPIEELKGHDRDEAKKGRVAQE